jgi:hypothetical protein
MYVLHLNYGIKQNSLLHMVACPNGERKILTTGELNDFLSNKQWQFSN